MKRKLLILGWDAADWQVINELRFRGEMPALDKVLKGASFGPIQTMDPPISPMLWTSIATGVPPEKHGILGFAEPNEQGTGIRPLFSTSRKVKAFWNMLNQYGYKCNCIGWWPSHPAEPINGVMVSNFFPMISGQDPENWPLPEGTIHPQEYAELLEKYRVHPAEITPSMVLPFIPDLYEIPQEESRVIGNLRTEIAKAATNQAAATWLMQNTEWDVLAVYYDFIDHLSHMGMKFRPPQLEGAPDDKFRFYKHVVDGAYRFQDMMLDRMLDLIDDSTAIMILSDHGFESGAMRPKAIPLEPAGPTSEHSPYGVFIFKGPGIEENRQILGASVIDITPTILHYFGLPVGKDMYGKVLEQCFTDKAQPKTIASWENFEGGGFSDGMHPPEKRGDGWSSLEALEQLIELGYIERPEGTSEEILSKSKAEIDYYLAQSLSFHKKDAEAIPLLERIIELYPDYHRYRNLIIQCFIRLRNWKQAEMHIEKLEGIDPALDLKAWFFRGRIAQLQHRPFKSLYAFDQCLKIAPNSPVIRLQKAGLLLAMGRYKEALELYRQLEKEDPRNPDIHFGIGMCCKRKGDPDQAIDHFLDALELRPDFAVAHFQLAESFREIADHEEAEQAYLTAISLLPGLVRARTRLISLYNEVLEMPEAAHPHQEWLNENSLRPLYCISGLPGSGIEEAIEILLSKGIRVRDLRTIDNPDQKAEIDLTEILSEKEEIVILTHAQLMRLPGTLPIRLVWMDMPDETLLMKQLELSGQQFKLDNKVFPTRLSILNQDQRRVFLEWAALRPQLIYLEMDGDNNKLEIEAQLIGFFEVF